VHGFNGTSQRYEVNIKLLSLMIHHDHQVDSIYIQSNPDQRKEGKELPAADI
jgi:hypothetical protein